jgi:BirA family transcriptional regulator, biotin operon repressor / biotin---[acetyl-CoA-carboxylase] ligase
MPLDGVLFWSTPLSHLGQECDPETLRSIHPTWTAEAERFGPWDPACLLCEGPGSRVWLGRGMAKGRTLFLTGQVTSSLDAGWHLIGKGCLPEWGSVLAASQTGGRGQLRRQWHSPPGNIYGALRLPGGFPWSPELLPLVAGYLFSTAFLDMGVELAIKWPNDLILAGRKVGGILIEERRGVCMAGIGINLLSSTIQQMRIGAAFPAGGLDSAIQVPTPAALWLDLVHAVENCYETVLSSSTSSEFISLVEKRLAFVGRRVAVDGKPDIRGRVAGISEKGGLILRDGCRETVISSGSIFPLDA